MKKNRAISNSAIGIILSLLLYFPSTSSAQVVPSCDTIYNSYFTAIWKITETDTFAVATLAPVVIDSQCTNRKKKKSVDALQIKVAKIYPYAKAAAEVMKHYEELCLKVNDPKAQKQLLNQAEDEMKKQFEKDLRAMTVSEGVLLIKLIDRETGSTSYALVQELKGKMSAFMWQGVARLFGHNLKDDYDPYGDDAMVENIVQRIEDGSIPVKPRPVAVFGTSQQPQ